MHLSALIPFLALPFLATSLPTSDQVDAVVHLERRAETAGSYPDGPNFRFLEANGGCSPNFNRVVNIVIVYQGFRCRFYREDNCRGQIGGFEGLPFPGGSLYQPARSATCWRG